MRVGPNPVYYWCSYKKGKFGRSHTQREDHVKTLGEHSLQAQESLQPPEAWSEAWNSFLSQPAQRNPPCDTFISDF